MVGMANVNSIVTGEEQVLRVASFVIQLLFLIYMRDKIIKLNSYYDERSASLSNYSLIMKNMPKKHGIQATLR